MSLPAEPASMEPIKLTSLEHSIWQQLQEALSSALVLAGRAKLATPLTLVLHDLVDGAVKAMHLEVFRKIFDTEFGLDLDGTDDYQKELYKTEVNEHGSQNIARYCKEHDWALVVSLLPEEAVLLWIDVPVSWDRSACQTERLIEALGYELQIIPAANNPDGRRLVLRQAGSRATAAHPPQLLDHDARTGGLNQIFESLRYGLIQFSPVGEVIAVSASMLTRLQLDVTPASMSLAGEAIPLAFYNDIIWGLALGDNNGVFENYRIRIKLPGDGDLSILFNVSGFRDENAVIHSLWQVVSQDEGGILLSQGSMLSEVRVHNITRNYVPQLVEEKARDAIRLGKTRLTNEERYVAVLFCDIVGFTSFVETNASSESIIDTLNSILRRVAGSVKIYKGSIDKFMGDCVMALFNDPADAVFAACDMQSHSEDINDLRSRAGQQTLRLRIGIHWGEVVIGNVGTVERLDWTAIGDVVNTASRIEKGCDPGSILISKALREAIDPVHHARIRFGDVFGLKVKGKWEELAVCHVGI